MAKRDLLKLPDDVEGNLRALLQTPPPSVRPEAGKWSEAAREAEDKGAEAVREARP